MELNGPAIRPAFDEEHYLRRGNERVRVTRVRRSAARAGVRGILWLLAGGLLTAGLFAGWKRVTTSPSFSIRHVMVEGCVRTDAAQVETALAALKGRNLFRLRPDAVIPDLSGLPWVERLLVAKKLPDTLVVQVVEREAAGWIPQGDSAQLLDRQGRPIVVVARDQARGLLPPLDPQGDWNGDTRRSALLFLSELRAARPGLAARVRLLRHAGPDWDLLLEGDARLLLDGEDWRAGAERYAWAADVVAQKFGPAAVVDARWKGQLAVTPEPGYPAGTQVPAVAPAAGPLEEGGSVGEAY